ncbi:hypothetical protein DVH26_28710 [Paenibacillus sp. H1-7]|uniref:DUF6886 family protein n=1 Tax=Paenibacillus sp. H1-7 TaxID=2282849 RepID=UPI001EF97728|nr:DUF6886 family protein [Paenibacillus sp. H1-7]ULL18095.1 hypothetical protein DVH26_28710 [Paenibacillus sp. H1-7]
MRLYHFSEDPDIALFEPRTLDYRQEEPAMVWAIDEFHAPHYYFPRNCPRVCLWPEESTSEADKERFFGHSAVQRIIAVESDWLERIRETKLYRYVFEEEGFAEYDINAGYYTSLQTVNPVAVEPIGDLLQQLSLTGIELRITPSLMPLRAAILESTVNFSMIRMKYAKQGGA